MRHSIVATRYAKSLLNLAIERGELDQCFKDMQYIAETCDNNKDLTIMLNSPVIRPDKKLSVLTAIFDKQLGELSNGFINIITKKKREIDLYSPEYLAKKHGINLNETNYKSKPVAKDKVSFGFYSSLIILLVFVIAFSRILYFFQDLIITKLPFTEIYLKYFFESIRNLFEIWKSLISNY